ncbi:fatty acid/phospholipid synthesis protein PlsX [Halobacteroides halobius DSM 5150]|uniref:Phosphate acyltransferase n=1 Tax=Halobacteroides halobius (strain ATCC 35273 / DSM 5150 / MD-1) TaxID=748449 RepID=L0K7X7_HALHC|nr:phosphate acyltransferase PlsX [Halobacteroides halobius]AGB41367.1 fatty acid/phospholipid synthesis protein PlsX [Halobacteroides halobius DSM 5150]
MKIAIDAMGGDDAPLEVVKGAVQASSDIKGQIILLGLKEKIKTELNKYNYPEDKIEIYHTSQTISMDESPARALRKKKDSSVVVGAKLVKEGRADAFVSAGNTGAVMAAGTLKVGRIQGVKRPAIATVFPGLKGETLVLDVGANADSKPEHLVQQAQMGQIYAKEILHKSNPTVGLLSIGEEAKKGNQLTKETYPKLKELDNINFVGNVEGRDIFTGEYDVILSDGFVGNVVLKTSEGLSSAIFKIIKKEIQASWLSKLGGLLLKPAFNRIKKKMDYTEYGGAPLLGVNGVTIIGHGSSNAKAIANAIKIAEESINVELIDLIKQNINEGTDK